MNSKKLMGVTIATAAALSFATVSATSAFAQNNGMGGQVKCYGTNACKGQSECKTAGSACKGQNTCKGEGFTMMSSSQDCMNAGGSTTEE